MNSVAAQLQELDLGLELGRWEGEGGALGHTLVPPVRFAEHTGEVEMRVSAPTLQELFAKSGEALAELMLSGEVGSEPESADDRVTLEAKDLGALLVTWLDELIYRAETERAVFTRFEVRAVSDRRLVAEIHAFRRRSSEARSKRRRTTVYA